MSTCNICKNCGKEIISKNSRGRPRLFCNDSCKKEYYEKEKVTCDYCGKRFKPYGRQKEDNGEKVFCSNKCKIKYFVRKASASAFERGRCYDSMSVGEAYRRRVVDDVLRASNDIISFETDVDLYGGLCWGLGSGGLSANPYRKGEYFWRVEAEMVVDELINLGLEKKNYKDIRLCQLNKELYQQYIG